ncbi:hypothetical protein PRIPAC_86867 [Pristionchus pacificus]|nr:hypothetical protein PRIPAC_86867 [Pristionchus pacificus]
MLRVHGWTHGLRRNGHASTKIPAIGSSKLHGIGVLLLVLLESTADLDKFAAPNDMSNVILKIGDEKLFVSKEYLSIHSPVFKTMFFGGFVEKEKEEVEIKDVDFKEFVDLLHVIYPGRFTITDATVIHVLGLGDRFQMERVISSAETHLRYSTRLEKAEKLRLPTNSDSLS